MKYLITIIALLILFSCNGQVPDRKKKAKDKENKYADECSKFYLFEENFIDLETMTQSDVVDVMPLNFKDCSVYKKRFLYEENGNRDSLMIDNKIYRLKENYQLEITDVNSGKIKNITLPVPDPLPEVYELYSFLSSDGRFPVVVGEDYYGTNYFIWKFDEGGKLILSDTIEKTKVTITGNTHHHELYLYFETETEKELIFSCTGMVEGKDYTIVLSKADFTKTVLPFRPCAYVPDVKEEKCEFYIWADEEYHIYKDGKDIAHFDLTDKRSYGADEGLICDSLLLLAGFHPNMSGSSLACISLKTGEVKWYADVIQMHIPHSKYSNQVILSRYKNKILMEGNESGGSYLQVFDLKTGKRLAAFGDVTKK